MIPVEACYLGWQESLAHLTNLVEPEIAGLARTYPEAVGGWIREAGKRDPQRLRDFLDRYAATMLRATLRSAIEQLELSLQSLYLAMNAVR